MTMHPSQPVALDAKGVLRFKGNAIVQYLLDNGPWDMNTLGRLPFSDDDRVQFAQLIGYSVSGFGELSYVSDEAYEAATAKGWCMSIRCMIGWHKMEPMFVKTKIRREQVMIPVAPSLFTGPPYLAPTGNYYDTDIKCSGWKCARCGKGKQP